MSAQTAKTVAKATQEYVFPIKKKLLEKPMRRQMLELHGKLDFGKGLYHNQNYENLIRSICQSRDAYRKSKDINERKKIAGEELKAWTNYVEQRKKDLPEEYKITEKMRSEFQQVFDLVKDRNEKTLKPTSVLRLHEQYAKIFKFQIPLDPRNIARIIHPHFGYLPCYPKAFELSEIFALYENLIVSGYEEYCGQDLLASEISAYSFWSSVDKNQTGYMNPSEFSEFMKIHKFSLEPSLNSIKSEFQFALNLAPGEIDRDIEESKEIVRFDLYRYIFLERNL